MTNNSFEIIDIEINNNFKYFELSNFNYIKPLINDYVYIENNLYSDYYKIIDIIDNKILLDINFTYNNMTFINNKIIYNKKINEVLKMLNNNFFNYDNIFNYYKPYDISIMIFIYINIYY